MFANTCVQWQTSDGAYDIAVRFRFLLYASYYYNSRYLCYVPSAGCSFLLACSFPASRDLSTMRARSGVVLYAPASLPYALWLLKHVSQSFPVISPSPFSSFDGVISTFVGVSTIRLLDTHPVRAHLVSNSANGKLCQSDLQSSPLCSGQGSRNAPSASPSSAIFGLLSSCIARERRCIGCSSSMTATSCGLSSLGWGVHTHGTVKWSMTCRGMDPLNGRLPLRPSM